MPVAPLLRVALLAPLLFAATPCLAVEALPLNEVLAASVRHYPKVLAAVEKRRASEGKRLAAEGAFDLQLKQQSFARVEGFYDGHSVDSKLVKPLADLGAEVFAGYRVTDGSFPVYEDEFITKTGGEFAVGIAFSLLRDRLVDERRFNLRVSEIGIDEADLEVLQTQVGVQHGAAKSWFNWVGAGQRLAILRNLLRIAEVRQEALTKRVAEGDLAEIFLTENQQNLLKRRTLVTEAEQDLVAARLALSLYLRNEAGEPVAPPDGRLPGQMPAIPTARSIDPAVVVEAARAAQPGLAIIDRRIEVERERVRLGQNALLPRVDLSFKTGSDIGSGSRTRDEAETIVGLEVAIPLETRRGRGQVDEARARIAQLELERRLEAEQLAAAIGRLGNALDATARFAALTAQEVEQAVRMEQAELTRFEEGASDFFLLNVREERTADARLREVDARLAHHLALVDYWATTVDVAALGLGPEAPAQGRP